MRSLDDANRDPVFDAQPCPTAVLDTGFTIRAVNRAYLSATGRAQDELVPANIFEAFPDNPEDPDCDGARNLQESLERVVRTGRPHHMWIQRYDIPDVRNGGGWLKKYWTPVNTPVFDDGKVIGVLHRIEDVTPLNEDLRRVLRHYRDIMEAHPLTDLHASRFAESAKAFAASARDYQGLVDEVRHLRRALTSRATIDQAKGIIMSERRCCPEEAFELMVGLSQNANVKVADVAAALVYKAQASPGAA